MPAHLRDTEDYRELMELKRLKRQKIAEFQVANDYFNELLSDEVFVTKPRARQGPRN